MLVIAALKISPVLVESISIFESVCSTSFTNMAASYAVLLSPENDKEYPTK
jgi:hypothetical protein